jgi:hypothetical protein
MKRRQLLLSGGATLGGASILGAGAFTSVAADRDVAVNVAGDSDAFLQLRGATNDNGDELPNAQYVRETSGTLELNFTGDNSQIDGGGEGFNARADTGISRVFESGIREPKKLTLRSRHPHKMIPVPTASSSFPVMSTHREIRTYCSQSLHMVQA